MILGGAALHPGQRQRPTQHFRYGLHAAQRGDQTARAQAAGLLQCQDVEHPGVSQTGCPVVLHQHRRRLVERQMVSVELGRRLFNV